MLSSLEADAALYNEGFQYFWDKWERDQSYLAGFPGISLLEKYLVK